MDANLSAALAAPFTLDVNPGHKASSFPNRAGSLDSAVMARAQELDKALEFLEQRADEAAAGGSDDEAAAAARRLKIVRDLERELEAQRISEKALYVERIQAQKDERMRMYEQEKAAELADVGAVREEQRDGLAVVHERRSPERRARLRVLGVDVGAMLEQQLYRADLSRVVTLEEARARQP